MLVNSNRIADKLFFSIIALIFIVMGGLGALIIHQRVNDVAARMSARAENTASYLQQLLARPASRLDAKQMRIAIESTADNGLQAVEIFDVENSLNYIYERAGGDLVFDKRIEKELVFNNVPVGRMALYFSLGHAIQSMKIKEFLRLFILISASGLVFGIGIHVLVKRLVLKPIDRTLQFSKELASGNYDKRIDVTTNDEMGMLQSSMNLMANELQEFVENLKASTYQAEGARLEALEASRLKSEFLANLSHEIRTPLNAIVGFTELLIENEKDDEKRETLETIRSSANILLENINEILDFSKIEAGKLKISKYPLLVADVIREIVPMIKLRLHGKDVEFDHYISDDLNVAVSVDRIRLRQVLMNVLINAAKFTASGKILLSAAFNENNNAIIFKVEDTGVGIPVEFREKVFEPFVQADGGVTREHGGTGLGLAIAKRLVEMMGGSIWIEDKPTQGTIVCFNLPV